MKRWLPVAALILGLLSIGYAVFFWSSDEEEIRARIDELGEAVSFTQGQNNPVVRIAHLNGELGRILTKDVSVRVPELPGVGTDRRDLAAAAAQVSTRWSSATLGFASVRVDLDPGKASAEAHASATLSAVEHGGAPRRESREVSFHFEKLDGDWRIATITVSATENDDEGE